MNSSAFWLFLLALIVAFYGDPPFIDLLHARITQAGCVGAAGGTP